MITRHSSLPPHSLDQQTSSRRTLGAGVVLDQLIKGFCTVPPDGTGASSLAFVHWRGLVHKYGPGGIRDCDASVPFSTPKTLPRLDSLQGRNFSVSCVARLLGCVIPVSAPIPAQAPRILISVGQLETAKRRMQLAARTRQARE